MKIIRALAERRRGASLAAAAAVAGVSAAAVGRAASIVGDAPPEQWEALLSDKRRGNSGRRAAMPVSRPFWQAFRADYLRPEQPTAAACYDRVADLFTRRGEDIPPLHAVRAKVRKLPRAELVYRRGGAAALDAIFPPQKRIVSDLRPLQVINGDGWPVDVFCRLPDSPDGEAGGVCRPRLWCWQDVATRLIVGWRLAETESAEMVMSSLSDVFADYGVPERVVLDNTRAVSSGRIGGGRRFGKTDMPGALEEIGIAITRTSLIETSAKTASGAPRRRGRGQAKPVERTFRIFADRVARHPRLAGFYAGASTSSKPENYNAGRDGCAWEDLRGVIAEEIERINNKEGRGAIGLESGESAAGRFAILAKAHPPRPATAEDFDKLLSPAETTKIKRDGTFSLRAGAADGFGRNRYFHDALWEFAGKHLTVRYDASDLRGDVRVFDLRGRLICVAHVLMAAGFTDTASAKEHNRARRQRLLAMRRAAAAERKESELRIAELEKSLPSPPSSESAPALVVVAGDKEYPVNAPQVNPGRVAAARQKFLATDEDI